MVMILNIENYTTMMMVIICDIRIQVDIDDMSIAMMMMTAVRCKPVGGAEVNLVFHPPQISS